MKKTNTSIKWHFIFKKAAKEQRLMFLNSLSKWNDKQICYGSSHAIPQERGRVSFPMKIVKFTLTSDLSSEAQLPCKRVVSVTGTHIHPNYSPFGGVDNNHHTFHILHNHAQVPLGLKGAEHADHEGILSKSQDISLHKGLLDLVPQDQVLFVDFLHGKTLASGFVPHQIHRSTKHNKEKVHFQFRLVCCGFRFGVPSGFIGVFQTVMLLF